jgi:TRAP-type C4-dicarboxylate transport system substrate-binding protein
MKLCFTLAAVLLVACGPRPPREDGVTELVYASPYGPNHPFSRADRKWMEFVETESGGSLTIKPSWSGALLSSEHSMLELRHGVADIGLITPIYVKGGVHLTRTQSGFYSGANSVEAQVALYRCLAASDPQLDDELAGLKLLAVQGGSLPGIVTRTRPVRRLADLEGMRIRAPTELLPVLRELGADPVSMPMGEVYSALAKGVLDGVVAAADVFLSLHFAEVTQFFTRLAVPRGAYPARAMNLDRWLGISPEHREILERGSGVWEAALAFETRTAESRGLEHAEEAGITMFTIAPDEQSRFDALYLREAEQSAASLARYGIDGLHTYRMARAAIGDDGTISCGDERKETAARSNFVD